MPAIRDRRREGNGEIGEQENRMGGPTGRRSHGAQQEVALPTKLGHQDQVNVLQINLNRYRAVHDLLEAKLVEENIEVVLVSEPYAGRIKGGGWYYDQKEGDVAI